MYDNDDDDDEDDNSHLRHKQRNVKLTQQIVTHLLSVSNVSSKSLPAGGELHSVRAVYNKIYDTVCLTNIQNHVPILAMTGIW